MQIPSFRSAATFFLFLLFSSSFLPAQPLNDAWEKRFDLPGVAGKISGMALDSENNLYVRGNIQGPNTTPSAQTILRWNGKEWSSPGITADTILVEGRPIRITGAGLLVTIGTTLYTVADDLDTALPLLHPGIPAFRRIVAWNGTTWNLVGESFCGEIYTLVAYGSALYAAGSFEYIGTKAIRYLARWDGLLWDEVGGGTNDYIGAMTIDRNGRLSITGGFDTAGTVRAEGSARWNGTEWEALSGAGYDVRRMIPAASGTAVYGRIENTFYRLQGQKWTPIDTGISAVYILSPSIPAVDGIGNIYLCGKRRDRPDAPFVILHTNGTTWSELPGEFDGELTSIATLRGEPAFAAGYFANVDDTLLVNALAHWNGGRWKPLVPQGSNLEGLHGTTAACAYDNGYLYVGGTDLQTSQLPGKHALLRRQAIEGPATTWETVGGEIEGSLLTIINNPTRGIYVGGCFNRAGNQEAVNVAWWDGSTWHRLGPGPGFCVADLSLANGNLYAVGGKSLARWDGRTWTRLADDIHGLAYTVAATDDGTVYVGGQFDSVGNLGVNNLAGWKEGRWHNLAGGVRLGTSSHTFPGADRPVIRSLAADGNTLYAGGLFDTAGATEAYNIARWDGVKWSAMDQGLTGYTYTTFAQLPPEVWKIIVAGNRIFAGGHFQNAGTWWKGFGAYATGSGIAYWEKGNERWESLGSGVSTSQGKKAIVRAIAAADSIVWVGGDFFRAGLRNSYHIARTTIPAASVGFPSATESLDFGTVPTGRRSGRTLSVSNPATSTRTLAGRIEIIEGPFAPTHDVEFKIAPGATARISLDFIPTTTGLATGRAIIYHNATERTTPLTVWLSGIGIPLNVDYTVEPQSIEFGEVVQGGSSETRSFVFRNASGSNSTITLRADVLPSSPFALRSNYYSRPEEAIKEISLAPGDSVIYTVELQKGSIGDFQQTLILHHNALPNGAVAIPIHAIVVPRFARLNLTPARIHFGDVRVGQTKRDTLHIMADPQSNISIDCKPLSFSRNAFFVPLYDRINLDPGEKMIAAISFSPKEAGTFRDTLLIARRIDGITDTLRVAIMGRGVAGSAGIALSATEFDFGSVSPGTSEDETLTITNPSSADDTLFVTPAVTGSQFSVDDLSQKALLPGQSIPLRITFAPTTSGTFNGTLSITHNGVGTESPIALSLHGTSKTSAVEGGNNTGSGSPFLAIEPNPVAADGKMLIRFRVDRPAHAGITIHSLDGRKVAQMLNGQVKAGEQSIEWDVKAQPPGAYLCTLTVEGKTIMTRLLVVAR